jgi:hypothetical protein
VIVGGSHSAFSAAWMCLHKLDLSVKDDATPTPTPSVCEKPVAHREDTDTQCCDSPLKTATTLSSPDILPGSPSHRSPNQEASDDVSDALVAATSLSKSVYKIKEIDKMKQKLSTKIDSISAKGMTGQSDVLILHRSYIKVFYSSKREADHDLYYDTGVINKGTGQIHPFGGLRGDSKLLWR